MTQRVDVEASQPSETSGRATTDGERLVTCLSDYGKMKLALFLAVVSLSGCGTITGSTSVSRSPSTAAVSAHPSAWQTVLTTEAEVTGVAVDGQGNIYVAELSGDRVEKFSSKGQALAKWGE